MSAEFWKDDQVFSALGNPIRRRLLDVLLEHDGLSLTELQAHLEDLGRHGLSKQLMRLEAAGLVVSRRHGSFKLHYLDRQPIQRIRDHWIDKFAAGPPCGSD